MYIEGDQGHKTNTLHVQFPSVSLTHCLSVSLCFSLSISFTLSLSQSLCLPLSLSLSLSFSLPLALYSSVCVSSQFYFRLIYLGSSL